MRDFTNYPPKMNGLMKQPVSNDCRSIKSDSGREAFHQFCKMPTSQINVYLII